ncbi:MAG: putative lipid kinase [Parcubacteria group bacterium Gr01-1014_18]|nr:MAG: putative lipid kinase [Parcubacteria group bacterium Greene0416_36]TSC81154.1 MAG: putative lipid kinase [Parcubacteria group bacterium Gr01-1014_18]TSC99151.1 MAG: putative lipid kinase [Parcubacteria group bacterium Greene1014_20]
MYSYIYDSFLSAKKYEKILAKIENAITDFDIRGRICRLTLLNTIKAIIEEEIRKGSKNIIVIGNDKTVSKALDVVVPHGVTLGIIPVGDENSIAELFGIPQEEAACQTISARMIREIPLGKINDSFFIHQAAIDSPRVSLECDNSYRLEITAPHHAIRVYNHSEENSTRTALVTEIRHHSNTFWNRYFASRSAEQNPTLLNLQTLSITKSPTNTAILLDGQKVINAPATITPAIQKLKIIVGKNRQM